MPTKDIIEKAVNAAIALGFTVFAAGVGILVYNLCIRFGLSLEITLVVFGLLIIMLGLIAAKIFSKVVDLGLT